MRRSVICLLLIAVIPLEGLFPQSAKQRPSRPELTAPYPYNKIRYIRQGSTSRLWMNNNGGFGFASPVNLDPPNYDYPVGSEIEHLYSAGLWVGAIRNGVRWVTQSDNPGGLSETIPIDTMIFQTTTDSVNGRNRRFLDDDGDGRIDEDELDGVDNDGDGSIDEDYGAVSEHDVYVGFTDTTRSVISNHSPLGIKIWQRSYSWQKAYHAPILPMEFEIVNIGPSMLSNVYVGLYCDFDVFRLNSTDDPLNFAEFNSGLRTVYVHNSRATGATPAGLTLLSASVPLQYLRKIVRISGPPPLDAEPGDDGLVYGWMACDFFGLPYSCVGPPVSPDDPVDVRVTYSVGPFSSLPPGDTIRVSFAFVTGDVVSGSPTSLLANAEKAIVMSEREFRPIAIPTSPPLRVSRSGNRTILDWKWKAGDPGSDPIDSWDAGSAYLNGLPDTNWRKQSPTGSPQYGGRNLGGFKVWRASISPGSDTSWTLLAQYAMDDVPTNSTAPNDQFFQPFQYSLAESTLHPGFYYGYAVTSFSFPDMGLDTTLDQYGNVITDTLLGAMRETERSDNATFVNAYFTPSISLGDVKVVPNPYRGDKYYTDGSGYEGDERTWTPDRQMIWFTHLPARATIRIYTLAGEVIATLQHDDGYRVSAGLPTGQQEWHLVSESGIPVASGLYIFSIDSDFGQQVGKFVIIL